MAGIPTNFQLISNVLPTYNFVDIISGTGYINFYAGKTVDQKLLSNFSYYSDTVQSGGTVAPSTSNFLVLDVDFDILLNRPLDISGLGIVNIPVACESAVIGQLQAYVIVFARKWDGVTETDISTNTSRVYTNTVAALCYSMLSVDLTIPLTHFKKGEILRLTVRLYGTNTNAVNTKSVYFAHDPKSRSTDWDTSGAVPSQLIFQCPVRLNL